MPARIKKTLSKLPGRPHREHRTKKGRDLKYHTRREIRVEYKKRKEVLSVPPYQPDYTF